MSTLKLLILSDIHLQKAYLEKLKNWYLELTKFQQCSFDYVLIPGDTCNVFYDLPVANTESGQLQAQAQITLVLQFLEFFGCQILYIPGNHDPLSLFHNKKLTKSSTCIHKEIANLRIDLQILGFGGSVPAYDKDNNQVWLGYPYQNQDQLRDQFKTILQKLPKSQYILMPHVGPYSSMTTYDRRNGIIKSGSKTLDEFLSEGDKNLLTLIHGHTHDGVGFNSFKNVTIVNPGSLSYGRFCIIDLSKIDNTWGVKQTRFYDLNYI